MTKCMLQYYVTHLNSWESSEAACRCMTHDWDFGPVSMSATDLCPIGRIEEARDAAIARIAQYVKDHIDAQHTQDVRPRSGEDDL